MPEFYIPPKDIMFRLKNKKTEKVLFSRTKSPAFGQFGGEAFADQWWFLEPGTGGNEGWYLVKSAFTKNCLFSRSAKKPYVDHTDGNGKWADQWFKIEPGTGDRTNYFRLLNTTTNTVITSGDGVSNAWADRGTDDNQYWSFQFEDMEFVSLIYHLDKKNILSTKPEFMGSTTASNNSSLPQEQKVDVKVAQTVTKTFEHTQGILVTGTVGASFGLPTGSSANVSISTAVNNEFKWGSSTSKTEEIVYSVTATAPPYTDIVAKVMGTRSELEVPFTITWKSKKTGYEIQTQGMYKGTAYLDVKKRTDEKPLSDDEFRSASEVVEGEWEDAEPQIEIIGGGEGEQRSLEENGEGQGGDGYGNGEEGEYPQEDSAPEEYQEEQPEERNEYADEQAEEHNEYEGEQAEEQNVYAEEQPEERNEYENDQSEQPNDYEGEQPEERNAYDTDAVPEEQYGENGENTYEQPQQSEQYTETTEPSYDNQQPIEDQPADDNASYEKPSAPWGEEQGWRAEQDGTGEQTLKYDAGQGENGDGGYEREDGGYEREDGGYERENGGYEREDEYKRRERGY